MRAATFITPFLSILPFVLWSQEDTLPAQKLENVVIKSYRLTDITSRLPEVHGTYIIGGRKSEVLAIQELPANLAEKTGRQLFAKVPGAFIYDMDGSGNQINIATRGLDPHRSWEFSVRQNGVMINSDIYGYPASHYSMPMEAIRNIEIVRGTASLQYGAEFGGMINYVVKEPDTTKPVSFESINTVGSFGLFSSFNALGGKVGRLSYYLYNHNRVSDGYRDNARSKAQGQYVHLNYRFSEKLNARLEVGRSQYLFQIPGPLTDSMFYANPRQATRSRNFFEPDIIVPSLTIKYDINSRTKLQWTTSGVFGRRNSVEFEGFADKADVIDPATLQYKPRTVNIDRFNSKTSEVRLLHHYTIGSLANTVTASVTYFNNLLHRTQQGKGTTGSDYDLTIDGNWGRDLTYHSQSISVALENLIQVTESFSVVPGIRYEFGQTDMEGYISYLDPADIPNQIMHRIPVAGLNAAYKFGSTKVYGGISQAYRPVLFKDIIPSSTLERANKDLKDAEGYNAELGIGGKLNEWLKYEVTAFLLRYNNRLGNLVLTDDQGQPYIYKTNIGDSQTNGVEVFAEFIPVQTHELYVSVFTSSSLMKGTYKNAALANGMQNVDISGNEIESVPHLISRNGLNVGYRTMRLALLYSFVGESFSDPANTELPTANGSKGIVPSYGIFDINMSIRLAGRFIIRAGINNVFDHQYFTKRPLFYPGPGVWSSDGRSLMLSLGARI